MNINAKQMPLLSTFSNCKIHEIFQKKREKIKNTIIELKRIIELKCHQIKDKKLVYKLNLR